MTTDNENKAEENQVEEEYPPLKNLLVQVTGQILKPENNQVTLEMVIHTLADHFPELVMALAEENFIRGYKQCLQDVEAVNQQPQKSPEECDIETDVVDADFETMKKDE